MKHAIIAPALFSISSAFNNLLVEEDLRFKWDESNVSNIQRDVQLVTVFTFFRIVARDLMDRFIHFQMGRGIPIAIFFVTL